MRQTLILTIGLVILASFGCQKRTGNINLSNSSTNSISGTGGGQLSPTPFPSVAPSATAGPSASPGSSARPSPTLPPPMASPSPSAAPGGGVTGVPVFGHVYIVLEENHSYSSVIGNAQMPYINSLANTYGLATNYDAVTHPSIGNYFALTTGQIITNNDGSTTTVTVDNLARHFIAAGKTWKEYSECIPSTGYTGGDSGCYTEHHNPFSYFSDVRNSAAQKNNLVDFKTFAVDLANQNLPNFSFIVPNNADNAHDGTLAASDNWLKNNIAPLVNSNYFKNDGLLIIVYDEGATTDLAGGGGHVVMIMVSSKVKPGYKSSAAYNHYSLLRTIMDATGVGAAIPGAAANATAMTDFF